MTKVKSLIDGFVAVEGVPVLLSVDEEFDADHPLVQARPDLFTDPPSKRSTLSRDKSKGKDD